MFPYTMSFGHGPSGGCHAARYNTFRYYTMSFGHGPSGGCHAARYNTFRYYTME
ncbi:hypothetical protein [Lachnoclostridium sp. An138]|uniref:hypothetical protein n=1 Tax=Lachnoclostridium sp. An138 TaxID=1965560 RepID=UPI0013A65290|nr:hypothetical protein [Lachnoclostridium sp. An138]